MTRFLGLLGLLGTLLAACASPVPPAPTTLPSLSEFAFVGVTATASVDVENRAVSVSVPYATDVHHLVARFVTDGSSVLVGTVVQESGVTENDFSAPVTYTVVGSGDTRAEYVVDVSVSSVFPNWTHVSLAGYKSWQTAVGSADGTIQYGITGDQGGIYRSTDSGHHWVRLDGAPQVSFSGLATNASGTFLVATSMLPDGYTYTSSDSGATWAKRSSASPRQWGDAFSDATGTHLLALSRNTDSVYLSSNSGVTWSAAPGPGVEFYSAAAIDTTGAKYAVLDSVGKLQVSLDSGTSWQDRSVSGATSLGKLSASGDFQLMAAAETMGGGLYISTDKGQNWTKSATAGDHDWALLSCSRDGTKVLAGVLNGSLYVSTDAGANFSEVTALGNQNWRALVGSASFAALSVFVLDQDPITTDIAFSSHTVRDIPSRQNWGSVSLSQNGDEITAVVNGAHVVTTLDSGTTWSEISPVAGLSYSDVLHSHDGSSQTIFANAGSRSFRSANGGSTWSELGPGDAVGLFSVYGVVEGTKLYGFTADPQSQNPQYFLNYSTNSGTNWTERTSAGQEYWLRPAFSSDGSHVVLANPGGTIKTSADFGASWTPRTSAGTRDWQALASSGDGRYLAAAVTGGLIYTSDDFGVTWNPQTSSGTHTWIHVASSPDGSKLAAITNDFGGISISSDFGKSWSVLTEPEDSYWSSVAFSGDGKVLYGSASNGFLWIGRQ